MAVIPALIRSEIPIRFMLAETFPVRNRFKTFPLAGQHMQILAAAEVVADQEAETQMGDNHRAVVAMTPMTKRADCLKALRG